jgi:hypothetical protein
LPSLPSADGASLVAEIIAATRLEHLPAEATKRNSLAHLDRTWGRPDQLSAPAVSIGDERYRLVY